MSEDLLFEIGTEEMPASALLALSRALGERIAANCQKAQLTFTHVHTYATPRRLAVWVRDLPDKQPDRRVEKRGPSVSNAWDEQGQPTRACQRFAQSCDVAVSALERRKTDKGEWIFYSAVKAGLLTARILPDLLVDAVNHLPLPVKMRWGQHTQRAFIRPVHWVVALWGKTALTLSVFGQTASAYSFGHRFHAPGRCLIPSPDQYLTVLAQHKVLADSTERVQRIVSALRTAFSSPEEQVQCPASLVEEVAGLVEYPVILRGQFESRFLALPKAVLTAVIQTHQRCFVVLDPQGAILPVFGIVSNIQSQQSDHVIQGNGRVMRARLSDAQFFYEADRRRPFSDYAQRIAGIDYHTGLGSLRDRAERLGQLAACLAARLLTDLSDEGVACAQRAGWLCLFDLASDMVNAFPALAGVMGCDYAKAAGESANVCQAIYEARLPRYAQDALPETALGAVVALAERMDTLVSVWGRLGHAPTGEKDPYGLRRAALGILRIILAFRFPLSTRDWISAAAKVHGLDAKCAAGLHKKLGPFLEERLRVFYKGKGIDAAVFQAVAACSPPHYVDYQDRITALVSFMQRPEAAGLVAANKRVARFLRQRIGVDNQSTMQPAANKWDASLFNTPEEGALARVLDQQWAVCQIQMKDHQYDQVLSTLLALQGPIDAFFDAVHVMDVDTRLRDNRLRLLSQVRRAFLLVADIALL